MIKFTIRKIDSPSPLEEFKKEEEEIKKTSMTSEEFCERELLNYMKNNL